ncbi:FkbM family methyltransferase [Confluentibacter citreus]|uniref:FkbM family methyltransferase n=1 Tax=Confluentibacter citreus TaxID=2007307 RepID=UPI0012FD30FF|nr:FkbM family methyltransferase [Confluentibacter citreus]
MFLYNLFPKRLKNILGRSKLLAPLRNLFFRNKETYREVLVKIKREYSNYLVQFNFYASIQVANKAKNQGIENTLLNNSIALLNSVDNDRTVFDVGTNFGYLSMVWANTVCEKGKVYSFEPHPLLFNCYSKSVKSNNLQDHIVKENVAVGNQLGTIEINLLSTSSNTLDLESNEKNNKKVNVNIITLDHYIERNNITKCDLIKIDVDGIEFDILNGSQELIKKLHPIFIVETNNDTRIIDFFNKNDYQILNMKLEPISEDELPSNIFCKPNK